MNVEGNVYLCRWAYDGQVVRAWLASDESVLSKGRTFEQAIQALEEKVSAMMGDGEARLEVIAPPLFDMIEPAQLSVVSICGQPGAHGPFKQAGLFSEGYCEYCDAPLGKRTKTSCAFDDVPVSDGAQNWCRGGNQLFSENFIAQLTKEERDRLDFLEIKGPRKRGGRMLELVGHSVGPFVAIKGIQPSSRKCEACGQGVGGGGVYYLPNSGSSFFNYLSKTSLPEFVPSCFAAGSDGQLNLCMTPKRWAEIVGGLGTKQLRSGLIAVLNENDVEPNPKMEIQTKEYFNRTRKKRKGVNII